jgi:hypothetical protein
MCNFTITITESAATFVANAQTQIQNAGGTFTGDAASGTFDVPTPLGDISGEYAIAGQDVTINIGNKPLVIGCGAIENYVKAHL